MKKLSLIFLSFIYIISYSQNTEGVITYVESQDMTKIIEESNVSIDSLQNSNPESAALMSGMKKKIEEFMKSMEKTKTQLHFKNNTSIYKEIPVELTESEVNQESNYMMAFKPKADIIYYNKNENQNFIQKDFMGKEFLIKDTLKAHKWKIVMEQKIIKGYPCMKAVKEDSLFIIEAWFSSQIPVSSGPKGLYGLPGMILQAKFIKRGDIKENPKKNMMGISTNIVITAETIEMEEVSKKSIKAPSKGQVLSSELEYIDLVTKKVKEMQSGSGFQMKM